LLLKTQPCNKTRGEQSKLSLTLKCMWFDMGTMKISNGSQIDKSPWMRDAIIVPSSILGKLEGTARFANSPGNNGISRILNGVEFWAAMKGMKDSPRYPAGI